MIQIKTKNTMILIAFCTFLFQLSGCSTNGAKTSDENTTKKVTDLHTEWNKTLTKLPIVDNTKTIYLNIDNSSDKPPLISKSDLETILRDKKYIVSDDPKKAEVQLHINTLCVEKTAPADIDLAKVGGQIGGLAGGDKGEKMGGEIGGIANAFSQPQKSDTLAKLGENVGNLAGSGNDAKTGKELGAKLDANYKESKVDRCKKSDAVVVDTPKGGKTEKSTSLADVGKKIGKGVAGEKGEKMGQSAGGIADALSDPANANLNSLGSNIGSLAGGEKGEKMGGQIGGLLDTAKILADKNVTFTAKLEITITEQKTTKTSSKKAKKAKKAKKTNSENKEEIISVITSTATNEDLQPEEASLELHKEIMKSISEKL